MMCGESVYMYKYWGDENIPVHARHRFLDTRRMKVTKDTGAEDINKILTEFRRSKKNRAVISTELLKGRIGVIVKSEGKFHHVMWTMYPLQLFTWVPRELLKIAKVDGAKSKELIELVESVSFEVAGYDDAVAMFEKMGSLLNQE